MALVCLYCSSSAAQDLRRSHHESSTSLFEWIGGFVERCRAYSHNSDTLFLFSSPVDYYSALLRGFTIPTRNYTRLGGHSWNRNSCVYLCWVSLNLPSIIQHTDFYTRFLVAGEGE